jgi:hypothetical protein
MRTAFHLAGVLLLLVSHGICADQKKPAPPPKAPPPAKVTAPKNNPGGGRNPKLQAPRINNPGLPQQLLRMTPEERERAIEQLPANRQAEIRQRLERLDQLPQAEKDRIIRQAQIMAAMPPAQRRTVNQGLNALNHLPDNRIAPMRRELVTLVNLPPEQRAERIASPNFKQTYSPEEQQILSDLSNNLPPEYLPGRKQ